MAERLVWDQEAGGSSPPVETRAQYGVIMWKTIETDKEITLQNGEPCSPIATLTDGYGRLNWIMDDGCYVLTVRKDDGRYGMTPHINPSAFYSLHKALGS